MRRGVGAIAVVFLVGALSVRCSHKKESPQQQRIHELEKNLQTYGSVAKIQSWLDTPDKEQTAQNAAKWPPGVVELKPSRVHLIDAGGVSLVWYAGDTMGVDVFPAGRRPTRDPITASDGSQLREPFGNDAYVWLRTK